MASAWNALAAESQSAVPVCREGGEVEEVLGETYRELPSNQDVIRMQQGHRGKREEDTEREEEEKKKNRVKIGLQST